MDALIPEAEKMIEVFTEYLNRWHDEMGEPDGPLTRERYNDYNDPPRVLHDYVEADEETRIIRLYAHPYHDEGGPNTLTGFFDFDDGIRYDQGRQRSAKVQPESWGLRCLIQYFDTDYTLVWANGEYASHVPPPKEVTNG